MKAPDQTIAPPPDARSCRACGLAGIARAPRHALTGLIFTLVWMYRACLKPFMGGHCRHTPTCSQYMLDAVDKHGPIRGAWRGLKRIARCHPWGTSGYDPA